jgi:hypothetical protein
MAKGCQPRITRITQRLTSQIPKSGNESSPVLTRYNRATAIFVRSRQTPGESSAIDGQSKRAGPALTIKDGAGERLGPHAADEFVAVPLRKGLFEV